MAIDRDVALFAASAYLSSLILYSKVTCRIIASATPQLIFFAQGFKQRRRSSEVVSSSHMRHSQARCHH